MKRHTGEELVLARRCLRLQLDLWDTQRELELLICGDEQELRDMSEDIRTFCAGLSDYVPDSSANELLTMWKEEICSR